MDLNRYGVEISRFDVFCVKKGRDLMCFEVFLSHLRVAGAAASSFELCKSADVPIVEV